MIGNYSFSAHHEFGSFLLSVTGPLIGVRQPVIKKSQR